MVSSVNANKNLLSPTQSLLESSTLAKKGKSFRFYRLSDFPPRPIIHHIAPFSPHYTPGLHWYTLLKASLRISCLLGVYIIGPENATDLFLTGIRGRVRTETVYRQWNQP